MRDGRGPCDVSECPNAKPRGTEIGDTVKIIAYPTHKKGLFKSYRRMRHSSKRVKRD